MEREYSIHYATHDTRLTHGHRKLRLAEDFEMLHLTPDFEILRLTCDFKTLHTSDAIFQNQASGATIQNLPPDAIFCDHASDVYHGWHSVWNTPSPSKPYLLWSGNQRRGTLSFTRMQFFMSAIIIIDF